MKIGKRKLVQLVQEYSHFKPKESDCEYGYAYGDNKLKFYFNLADEVFAVDVIYSSFGDEWWLNIEWYNVHNKKEWYRILKKFKDDVANPMSNQRNGEVLMRKDAKLGIKGGVKYVYH